MDRKVKAAALSIASNSTLVSTKLVVGIMSGSVSIISEAAHSALDLFAAIIAFASVRASGRPADREHPFGHGKIENLSGAVEAILIFVAAAYIIYESVLKLRDLANHAVGEIPLGIAVMGLSAVMNTIVSRYLFKVARETDSMALEADGHHLSTDVWTSVGVLVGLGVIQITDWHVMDPIVALVVAAMILRVSVSLTWSAARNLIDVRLPDDEVGKLREIVMATPRIVGYHKLRTRKSGQFREIDYHLIVPSNMPVLEAHTIAENIEDKMRMTFPNTHVVTHIEPDTEDVTGEPDTEIKQAPGDRKTRPPERFRGRTHQA